MSAFAVVGRYNKNGVQKAVLKVGVIQDLVCSMP